jgi:predicted AlkP superfamily phosphohydrolase/phosphomutase
VLVLGEIDRAQHDFWRYADPRFPEHAAADDAFRQAIAHHYEVSDQQLGRLLAQAGDGVHVILMSDHGGGPHPERYFHTNAWLRQQGWLATKHQAPSLQGRLVRRGIAALRRRLPFEEKLRRMLPAGLVHRARQVSLNIADVDWSRTRAYRFNMYHPAEGIEINLRGRQLEGIVAPGAEFERLVAEIGEALRRATDPETGRPIAVEVYRKEEIYDGPYLEIAPDLVAVLDAEHKPGVESAGPPTAPVPLGDLPRDHSGVHTMDGILIARGPGIRRGASMTGAQIGDLAPTILYLAGEVVPAEMDGRVLEELFEPEHLALHPVVWGEQAQAITPDTGAVSDEDDAAMRDKLRGLGYID